nr:molecular chaperone [uncultured Cedecea sp.]
MKIILLLIQSLLLLLSFPASAGISVDVTRIIFQESDSARGKTIGIRSAENSGSPYLIKAQVIKDILGSQVNTPFFVAPSLFRIEPGTSNQVVIMKKDSQLPHDRESLFYFRAVAVPASAKGGLKAAPVVAGELQVASATVLKLYYRPAGLSMPSQQAFANLKFTANGKSVDVSNASPYFVTLSGIKINSSKITLDKNATKNVIPPYSSLSYNSPLQGNNVTWTIINDYGGHEVFNGKI